MKKVPLGELCDIVVGRTPSRSDPASWGEGFPWLSIADMAQGRRILRTKEQITEVGARTGKLISPGTVLLSFKLSIGKVGIAQVPLFTNEAIVALPIKNPSAVDSGYLAYALQSIDLYAGSNRAAMGATLNKAALSTIPVRVPSMTEQRRIAAILDQADAIRTKRRQVLAHLDALTQALIAEVVRGVETRVPFGEAVSEFRYGTSAKSGPSGYPALRIPNVIGGTLDLSEIKTVDITKAELDRLRLESRDLLFVRSNGNRENVGRCAVFEPEHVSRLAHPPDQWIYASYLIRARIRDDFDSAFLAAYMASPEARRQLGDAARTSAGQFNINIQGLKTIQIPEVSLHQQARFSARNATVRALVQKHARVDAAQERLFASLQSRAFKGEL